MGYALMSSSKPLERTKRYQPPSDVHRTSLRELLGEIGRPDLEDQQLPFLGEGVGAPVELFYSGRMALLKRPSIAIVGARNVSDAGAARARRLSKELAEAGVTIVSGLAKGVDAHAHRSAIAAGGSTVGVIGTSIAQAYPAENAELQREIADHHLLISPFPQGARVFPSNFPKRNCVMAAVSEGSAIVEASDTSGTLHQAAECQRLGRWLFILRTLAEDTRLTWPAKFIGRPKVLVVSSSQQIAEALAL